MKFKCKTCAHNRREAHLDSLAQPHLISQDAIETAIMECHKPSKALQDIASLVNQLIVVPTFTAEYVEAGQTTEAQDVQLKNM